MPQKQKKTQKKKRLVLLDAHAIIHRAYHALPDFESDTGEPTGALYGLGSMLMKIIDELKPDYIVAAYDLPGPTKRHEVFDEYKAGRQPTDSNLKQQISRSRDLMDAFAIPIYEREGFEADDIIGTIVDTMSNKNIEIIIASGDLDTLQLVSGNDVKVYTQKRGMRDTIIYDERGVKERFGFSPELLPDYKGLRGDPSDNIPGVRGIGEKTATQLITKHGDIDAIYKALEKNREKFEKDFSPRIAKLLEDGKDEAHFSKMLAEIRRDAPIGFTLPKKEWRDDIDRSKLITFFRDLGFRSLVARAGAFLDGNGGGEEVTEEVQEETLYEDVADEEVQKTGIALWLLNSEQTSPTQEDILQFAGTRDFAQARDYIFSELKKQGLERLYKEVELPLMPVIEKMQERGIALDVSYLKKLSKDYHRKLEKLAERIYEHAGDTFNINSPQQLAEILYDKLGLQAKAKTATGRRSTRESELTKLKDAHEIVSDILDYRELQKLLSTYIDALPVLVSPKDKRLHTTYVQTGTTTGRMSSQNPNLQNIPIRTELGRGVRRAFVAARGYKLVDLDYSQIELRVSAALSGDKTMIKIFKNGEDIHTEVARDVFGSDDKDARRKAKVINFGIHYGMGVVALGRATGASRKEAQAFLDAYKKRFSTLWEHIEKVKREARKRGYTETLFGRRRYLPGLASHLPYVRAEAERMAVNAPIQGTNADIMKIAMIRVDEWITKEGLSKDVFLVMQIHDELVYEVKEKLVKKVTPKIREIMEGVVSPAKLSGIPLVADASVGGNWNDTEKLK